MATPTRTSLAALLALALLASPRAAARDEELLPAPPRPAERRLLGSDDTRKAFYEQQGAATGAAFSPDGKLLFVAARHQGFILWDLAAGRPSEGQPPMVQQEGLSLAFTPDGKRVITATYQQHQEGFPVLEWDAARRQRLRSLDEATNDTPFSAVAVSPDGKTVALAAGPGRRKQTIGLCLWDLASGDEILHIDGPADAQPARSPFPQMFQALAYSSDGRTLAALLDGRVLLYEVATGKTRAELFFTPTVEKQPNVPMMPAGSLAFSPDGRSLAVGGGDGAVRRFDLRTGRELTPFPGQKAAVVALRWVRDGDRILCFDQGGQFASWRAGAAREWTPKPGPLSAAALGSLWNALGGDDPVDVYGSTQLLAASPAEAVPYLRKRLTVAPRGDTERLDRLVADLLNGDYNVRKRAAVGIRKAGVAALPVLRRAVEGGSGDELTGRLIMELEGRGQSASQVRELRAVGVLERIGNDEAGKLLKDLAGGATPLAERAKLAAGRLEAPGAAESKPEKLWEALANGDSAAAYRAVRRLAQLAECGKYLGERLKEADAGDAFDDDPKRVAKCLADLDSDSYETREKATKALEALGSLVTPALKKALAGATDVEVKRRLQRLVDQAVKGPGAEMLRVGRALEALEMRGGESARLALAPLAKDARRAWLRQAAGESLSRVQLAKR